MSDRQRTRSSKPVPRPSPPEVEISDSDSSSPPDEVFHCSCGIPDAFENWIYCDSASCSIKWYHWQCVGVTAKPCGYWLCPRCCQKSNPNIQERRSASKALWSVTAKRTPADRMIAVNEKTKGEPRAADKTPVRVKKGIAVKKAPSKKTRSTWVGYVEADTEGEEEDLQRAERASIAAKTRRSMVRATKSRGRLTRSGAVGKDSKTIPTGASKNMRSDVTKDSDEVVSRHAEDAERKGFGSATTSRGEQTIKVPTVAGMSSSPSLAKDGYPRLQ